MLVNKDYQYHARCMIPSFATISCRSAGPLEVRGPWHSALEPPTKDGPDF